LDIYTYGENLKSLKKKLSNIEKILNPNTLKSKLEKIEKEQLNPDFWSDTDNASQINKEKTIILQKLNAFTKANDLLNDANDLFDIVKEEEDEDSLNELFDELDNLKSYIHKIEVEMMLNHEDDSLNAILSIHPGAGGVDSCDFASILYRMYLRWGERNNFTIEILDYQNAEEAGIKDVSLLIKGINAYGYLKVESGIHRLVRISPFNANAKRHTSFCSVLVSPEITDDINIEIEDKDIRIDTYRASGAGGQHVNKTDSAIRITHLKTNIVVQCQNDRSQHKNKANALKMLKSKLYELEIKQQEQENNKIEKSNIGWGSQIRSYVMQPYQQIKDNRSNIAYTNVTDVLDGNINKIIEDVLVSNHTNNTSN
jgi:peptide chain release factor 2